jgi:hypothetical protein
MPDMATIIASRGRVDYYLYKGIPVARSWPRKSSQPRSAAEIRSSENFTWAAKVTSGVSTYVAEAYKREVTGYGITWVDFQRATSLAKPWVSTTG